MTATFAGLGLHADLVAALARQGITEPFPIQELTIADALAGRDVLGKAKTGSGKTLAFGLPLLGRIGKAEPRHPRGLILVPTRELATQVTDALRPLGEVCEPQGPGRLRRRVAWTRRSRALQKGVDVVVGTPGRLIDLIERGRALGRARRGARRRRGRPHGRHGLHAAGPEDPLRHPSPSTRRCCSRRRSTARSKRLVDRYMDDPVSHEVDDAEPTVDEMDHVFLAVHQMDKVKVAASIAQGANRTLVFVRTKRGADRLVDAAAAARACGPAPSTATSARARGSGRWPTSRSGKVQVLVATDVAARGIHVDGVDVVVHYDPPEDEKAYLHRSGRTARAGESGVAVTLMLWNQENEVRVIQRRLGLQIPVVEIFSNDPRLLDLPNWSVDGVAVSA